MSTCIFTKDNGSVVFMSFLNNYGGIIRTLPPKELTNLLKKAQAVLPPVHMSILNRFADLLHTQRERDLLCGFIQLIITERSKPYIDESFINAHNPYGTSVLCMELDEQQRRFPHISPMLWKTLAFLITQPDDEEEDEEAAVHHLSPPFPLPIMRALVMSWQQTTDLCLDTQAVWHNHEKLLPIIKLPTLQCVRLRNSVERFPRVPRPQRENVSAQWFANLLTTFYTVVIRRLDEQLMQAIRDHHIAAPDKSIVLVE